MCLKRINYYDFLLRAVQLVQTHTDLWGDSTSAEAVLRLLEVRATATTLRGNVSIQPSSTSSTTRALEHEQTLNQTKRRTNSVFHSAPMPVLF